MFLIFGDKERTEPVEGGARLHRTCPKCAEHALFIERVVSRQFRLYFVDMFTHGTHHVLECTSCRTTFVTDEVQGKQAMNDQSGTVVGKLQTAFEQGKRALASDEVMTSLRRAESEATKALDAGKRSVGAWVGRWTKKPDTSGER